MQSSLHNQAMKPISIQQYLQHCQKTKLNTLHFDCLDTTFGGIVASREFYKEKESLCWFRQGLYTFKLTSKHQTTCNGKHVNFQNIFHVQSH